MAAASFKAVNRGLGRTLKQVAAQRGWGILGALVGAAVGTVLLRRRPLQAREPADLPELIPAPVGELTPPHGDPLTRRVDKPRRTKKRSRTQAHAQRSSATEDPSDSEAALQASAATASEHESTLLAPPPPSKGTRRGRSTPAPRRGRSHPTK